MLVTSGAAVQPVLHAVAERGRVAGGDVAVVGLCTDAVAEAAHPMVTNVSLEPRDVSRRAVRLLFRLLDRDAAPEPAGVELVTPRLSRRETTIGLPGRLPALDLRPPRPGKPHGLQAPPSPVPDRRHG
jgi:DNA-binding LacI/PurR family transcriptional regulator